MNNSKQEWESVPCESKGTEDAGWPTGWPWFRSPSESEEVGWWSPWWWPPNNWWRWGWQVRPDWLYFVGEDGGNIHSSILFRFLELTGHIDAISLLDEVHEFGGILANDDRPKVTGNVMPCNTIVSEFVVLDGKASFVMVLLKAFNGNSDIELGLDWSGLQSFEIVGLLLASPTIWKISFRKQIIAWISTYSPFNDQ